MIKGIAALFSSKIIFNPFVLTGVVYGFYLCKKFKFEEIFGEYQKFQIYLLVLILSVLYNIFFKRHLKMGGFSIDWTDTSLAILGSVFRFFFSSILAICFVNFLSF